jgi:hypothetical protein
LAPSHTYDFELDFSDRLNGPLVGNAFTTQGFDLRTDGSFTTAPAPSIGFGLPVFLAVSGVWFGAGLLERNPTRRNSAVLTGAQPASSGLLAAALIAIGFVKPRRRGADLCNTAIVRSDPLQRRRRARLQQREPRIARAFELAGIAA